MIAKSLANLTKSEKQIKYGNAVWKKTMILTLLFLLLLTAVASIAYGETYSYVTKWGSQGSGDGQFNCPEGITVDDAGNVYVVDALNHRVQKFTSDGAFVKAWGSQGSGDGQFRKPSGIAVDSVGNIYVTEDWGQRVQKFTSDGQFILKWGSYGSGDGQFSYPFSITIDDAGNVYVTDLYNSRVQKFTSDGQFILKWGSFGRDDGQFGNPHGVDVDNAGNVYVSERDGPNTRIQKFTSDGQFILKWGSQGFGEGQFIYPTHVAVDSIGDVYVTDYHSARVQKFNSEGTYLLTLGSQGSGDGQFNLPGMTGVAVDNLGNIYICDAILNRVQKFAPIVGESAPTIELTLPVDCGVYSADAGITYNFSATDNIDLSVELTANIVDTQGTAIEIQNGNPLPTTSGVYTLNITATNDAGLTSNMSIMFILYDPNAGYVTGGGWFDSPQGAYMIDTSLTGKATFGFVSKYATGTAIPNGQTQFQFKVADFTFHSTSYDWLVVAGAKTQYKGSGTINGEGNYGFILTALDGQIKGDNLDTFRIKIWNKATDSVIYDNQINALDNTDPTTIISGSIIIHK